MPVPTAPRPRSPSLMLSDEVWCRTVKLSLGGRTISESSASCISMSIMLSSLSVFSGCCWKRKTSLLSRSIESLSTRTGDDEEDAGTVHVNMWSWLVPGPWCSRVRLEMRPAFLGCFQDVEIVLRNYHSDSSVVRDDESDRTEGIWSS